MLLLKFITIAMSVDGRREVKWWDPRTDFNPCGRYLFAGPSSSGKTTVMRAVARKNRKKFVAGVAIAPSPGAQEAARMFIPSILIKNTLDLDELAAIIKGIEEFINMEKYAFRGKPGEFKKKSILLMFDDFMTEIEKLKKKEFKTLINQGRHYGLCIFMLVQYMMEVPTFMRGQFTMLFFQRDSDPKNQKKIYEYFVEALFPSLHIFKKSFMKLTEKYLTMVVHREYKHDASSVPTPTIMIYKANIHHDRVFRFGSMEIWAMYLMKARNTEKEAEEKGLTAMKDAIDKYGATFAGEGTTTNTTTKRKGMRVVDEETGIVMIKQR